MDASRESYNTTFNSWLLEASQSNFDLFFPLGISEFNRDHIFYYLLFIHTKYF